MPVIWDKISIAIYDIEGHLASIQKSILRGAGARKVGVVESIGAAHKDIIFGRDLVLINWPGPGEGFADVVRGVRDKRISPDPFVGVIVVASCPVGARVRAALDAGANSFLRLPFRAADFLRHIEAASAPPASFIDTPSYFGPDRRRRDDPMFVGPERRARAATRLEGALLEKERERMRTTARTALEIKVSMMG